MSIKKFSKISNVSVDEKKPLVKEENQVDDFKIQVMMLMDNFLHIQSYGSARPEIMIPTKISGKEIFIEALTDLLSKGNDKKDIELLESLKSSNNDWKSIDDRITEISEKKSNVITERKVNNIISKYKDEGSIKLYIESVLKVENKSDVEDMMIISNELFNKTKNPLYKSISEGLMTKIRKFLGNKDEDIAESILGKLYDSLDIIKRNEGGIVFLSTSLDEFQIESHLRIRVLTTQGTTFNQFVLKIDNVEINCSNSIARKIYSKLLEISKKEERLTIKDARIHFTGRN